jgi:hypothetical protein
MRLFKRKQKEVKKPVVIKYMFKVENSSSVMTGIDLNKLYNEGYELLEVINVSKNSFTHIFKRR